MRSRSHYFRSVRSCWLLVETFVVVSGGIDLSVGFTMGFAAVVFSKILNLTRDSLGESGSLDCGRNRRLSCFSYSRLDQWPPDRAASNPPFIGTLGMYGVARGIAYLLAGGTTYRSVTQSFRFLVTARFSQFQ